MKYEKLWILIAILLACLAYGYVLVWSWKIQSFYSNKWNISWLMSCKLSNWDYTVSCLKGKSWLNWMWEVCTEYWYSCHSNNEPQ